MLMIVAKIRNSYVLSKCNKLFKGKIKFYCDAELKSVVILDIGSTFLAILDGMPFKKFYHIINYVIVLK